MATVRAEMPRISIVENTGESGRLIKNYIAALSSGSEGVGRVNSVMNESPQGVLKKLLETYLERSG